MSIYFTQKSYNAEKERTSGLEKILRELQSQVQNALEVGGDLWHDNASYEYLLTQIDVADRRLSDAHKLLNEARIIEYPRTVDKVCLGSEVDLLFDEEKRTYQIVAYGESDPTKGRILYSAPIATAIIGLEPGETTTKVIGSVKREIEILNVRPLPEDYYST